jgi:hypothetical protein
MKMKNIIINILIIYLFSQNIFSQQTDTLKLRFRKIPKLEIIMPCRDLGNCIEKVTSVYQIQDTLYVFYDVDSVRERGVFLIPQHYIVNKSACKMSLVIPFKSNINCNYVVIRYYRYVYLFKKRKNKYVFQREGSYVYSEK